MGSALWGHIEQQKKDISAKDLIASLSDEEKKKIMILNTDQLEDDPWNEEMYGSELEVEQLAKGIKEYGFQGVIVAYPLGNGKYRIESGHRRRAAALSAGINEFPVYVSEAPKTDYERRIRLAVANSHNRKMTPTRISKTIKSLKQAHKDELLDKIQKGEVGEQSGPAITKYVNEKVSEDMELSPSMISRYETISELVPELQNLADLDGFPWTALTPAKQYCKENQEALAKSLIRMRKIEPDITKSKVKEEVDKFAHVRLNKSSNYAFDREDTSYYPEVKEEKKKAGKRVNYKNKFYKLTDGVMDFLEEDVPFKEKDIELVVARLKELQEVVEKTICSLEKKEEL